MMVSQETLAIELRVPPGELSPLIEGLKQSGLVVESWAITRRRDCSWLSIRPQSSLERRFAPWRWIRGAINESPTCSTALDDVEARHLNSVTLR